MSQKCSLASPRLTLLTMSASPRSSPWGPPPSSPGAAAPVAAGGLLVPAPKRSVNFGYLEASISRDFNFFRFSAPPGRFFLLSTFKLRTRQFQKRSQLVLTNVTTGSVAARPARPSRSRPPIEVPPRPHPGWCSDWQHCQGSLSLSAHDWLTMTNNRPIICGLARNTLLARCSQLVSRLEGIWRRKKERKRKEKRKKT